MLGLRDKPLTVVSGRSKTTFLSTAVGLASPEAQKLFRAVKSNSSFPWHDHCWLVAVNHFLLSCSLRIGVRTTVRCASQIIVIDIPSQSIFTIDDKLRIEKIEYFQNHISWWVTPEIFHGELEEQQRLVGVSSQLNQSIYVSLPYNLMPQHQEEKTRRMATFSWHQGLQDVYGESTDKNHLHDVKYRRSRWRPSVTVIMRSRWK